MAYRILTSDQVKPGDALPELSIDVKAIDIVLGAMASRDWRPQHHDYHFATHNNGVRDIFMNTPNLAAWFERYVTDWTGPYGRMGWIRFRMKDSVFPGETMVFTGTVKAVDTDARGCTWAELEISAHVGGPRDDGVHGARGDPRRPRATTPGSAAATIGSQRGEARRAEPPPEERSTEMDLDFTEEQHLDARHDPRDARRALPDRGRAPMEDDPKGYPDGLWKQIAELGLAGMLIPEAYGGSAQSLLDAALVYEEFGRALAPTPHFVSCVLSARDPARGGQRGAEGGVGGADRAAATAILTPAWLEPDRGYGPIGVALEARARRRATSCSRAPSATCTSRARPTAWSCSRARRPASTCSSSIRTRQGVTLTQQLTLGSDCQYRVDFRDVRVPASARIGAPGTGWETWSAALHEGIILLAAQAIGGADRALEITVEYAKTRKQFDKPLGAFQSLAHYMADTSTRIDGGRTLVYEAAWNHAQGRAIAKLAPMAKLFACETYRETHAHLRADLGRRRLHDRVRHPAVLPARRSSSSSRGGTPPTSRS